MILGLIHPGTDAYGTTMWTPLLAEFPSGTVAYTYPPQRDHGHAQELVMDGLRDFYEQPYVSLEERMRRAAA